ncbi:MAG: DsrE family protein [Sulfurimonas sp.]|uniref:DsrE family protein n=1 Tax=Sulfurimonas sp. TaxID=2022749 RepID=UPI00260A7D7E|nr:DsrE family protein [Sulfurimonas sp.]MCW8896301.1 DsrE family protein [Sulfurimonas sp.]MCW8954742.1 DsrE family protein [Sulfurimonas sp.]MCW9068392.1 DsrE family protein [Sulfurimonas sp.]
MKYMLLMLLVLSGVTQAKEYKAVFDCSSKNSGYVASRMFLIERTIDMIEKNGDSAKFVLTIHGSCAPIVSRNFDEVITDDSDLDNIQKAQTQLARLANKKDVEVVVCAMSLNANTIEEEDVLPFVKISKNSFIETIGYQNDGYALMTFK